MNAYFRPEEIAVASFWVIALAETLVTAPARVRRKIAKELRDKAIYDCERSSAESPDTAPCKR